MILLLTLAGRDARFESEGLTLPKYLLPWGDQSILAAILSEFLGEGEFSDVCLVVNREDDAYLPHVRAIMRNRGIKDRSLVLTPDTRGQAETAMVGLAALESRGMGANEPILINSVDTILYGRNIRLINDRLRQADGFVDVFTSSDRSYSYVLLDENGRVTDIAEKMVVSNIATSGCYGFRNVETYRRHFESTRDVYISAVFKKLIAANGSVVAGERHSEDDTVVLGTPQGYLNAAVVHLTSH